jgi:predicted Zn finger-like uncharacterized protein
MKIVCGSCQAKYSIADEKVQGKVFKIRCKRCSEVIVVRGDEGAHEPAAAAPAFDAGGDAIWHVVISGEQSGPYSPAQLGEMLTAGHVDWEAYVWAEGFDNWCAMRDVPDLVAAITGQGQPQAVAESAYAAQPSMGADPFADDGGGGGGGGLFAEPAAAPARASLFGGGQDASPFDDGGPSSHVVASAPSPRVSVEQAMTGARNENSVLFSLKNLQALATGSSGAPAAGASPAASSPMGPGNRPGFAGGDGSGLIDIRALASATGMGDKSGADSDKDALLSLGSAQTGAFGALGSPMLAPAGAADDDSGKKGLIFAIVGGAALLAAAIIVAVVLLRPQAPMQAPIEAAAPPPAAAAAAAAANPQLAAATPVEPPSEGEKAAAAAAAAAAAEPSKPSSGAASPARRREASGDKSPAASEPTRSEPVAARVDDKPKAKGGSSSIDELLEGAIGGGSSKPSSKASAAPAAASNLPEKPSREDVLSAMNGVKDAVKACGGTGVAIASVTVSGKTGRVSGAEISGVTGEAGSCIARAVRKASFPKFQTDSFQVKYPFKL